MHQNRPAKRKSVGLKPPGKQGKLSNPLIHKCGYGCTCVWIQRVVAVSKTKPASMVEEAIEAGHHVFGENYVQELVDKAAEVPHGAQWHFIGPLQSNKARQLLSVPSLTMLETVDREKIASKVDAVINESGHPNAPLPVMVQVNTSGETSKSGVQPGAEAAELCQYVHSECANLHLAGLMTIGSPEPSEAVQCFELLKESRDAAEKALTLPAASLELSMGMSNDWEQAISHGATSIRIGSAIFGARQSK